MTTTSAAETYRRIALDAVPRLLGAMDRQPLSPTAGSFDRDHWAWKFRDAPVMTLQMALGPLATLWREEWPGNTWTRHPRLLEWLVLGLEETLSRQGRHGGFETVGPNTWDHGVTLAMCLTMASVVDATGDALAPALRDRALEACARGCTFAGRTSEDYAFISNHQALFALAYYRVGRLTRDAALLTAGDACVEAIVHHQSRDGWYAEYGGPDAGYETLGLHYLAQCMRERDAAVLRSSMERSVGFLSHCVHPDGSLGGVYGSRHCSLYYPGGIEHLAARSEPARAIARFLAPHLARGTVVTPATCDIENLPTLLASYLQAAHAAEERTHEADASPLPAHALDGLRHFEDSGITVAGAPGYYAVTNASKGGVLRVFDRRAARCVFDDAGLIVEAEGQRWSSQLLGAGRATPVADGAGSRAAFARVKLVRLTPLAFLVLRLLNLTVFRSLTLGAFVRRRVIGHLITGRDTTDRLTLEREVRFLTDRVEVRDVLRAVQPRSVSRVFRSRAFTAIHMGSANYFVAADAESTLTVPADTLMAHLHRGGVAEQRFAIVFPANGNAFLEDATATDPAT